MNTQRSLELSIQDANNRNLVEETLIANISKLEQLYSRIIGVRVFIHQPHKNQRKGNAHLIKIDVKLPDHRIIVKCESNYEELALIHKAFKIVQRQVRKHLKRHYIKKEAFEEIFKNGQKRR